MKHYSPTGSRNHGRPLKRILDTWDRNGSTSGPTAWQIYDDDDNDDQYNTTGNWRSLTISNQNVFFLRVARYLCQITYVTRQNN
jgi:hypothetical protein